MPPLAGLALPAQWPVSGAALTGTFASSLVGVAIDSLLPGSAGGSVTPDWALGSLLGLGGLAILLCLLGGYYLMPF